MRMHDFSTTRYIIAFQAASFKIGEALVNRFNWTSACDVSEKGIRLLLAFSGADYIEVGLIIFSLVAAARPVIETGMAAFAIALKTAQ